MDKLLTKEEILGNNDIGSSSLYFNRAMDSMDEWGKQTAIGFFKWYADKILGFIEYLRNIKPMVTSNEIEQKLIEFEGKSFEQLYELYTSNLQTQ